MVCGKKNKKSPAVLIFKGVSLTILLISRMYFNTYLKWGSSGNMIVQFKPPFNLLGDISVYLKLNRVYLFYIHPVCLSICLF